MSLTRFVGRLAALAAVGLLAVAPRAASAGSYVGKFKLYTDRAAWQADAAAPRTTVDLSGSGPLPSASGVGFGVLGGTGIFPDLLGGVLSVTPSAPGTSPVSLTMQLGGVQPSGIGFDLTSTVADQTFGTRISSPFFVNDYTWEPLPAPHASAAGETQFFGILPQPGTCGDFLVFGEISCPTMVLSVELTSTAGIGVSNIELAASLATVPEPASLALTGLGLGTLAVAGVRSRRRRA